VGRPGGWQAKANSTVTGRSLDCGHFLQEERPDEIVENCSASSAQCEIGAIEEARTPRTTSKGCQTAILIYRQREAPHGST